MDGSREPPVHQIPIIVGQLVTVQAREAIHPLPHKHAAGDFMAEQ